MKYLHFNIELYKELKELWDWLGFCIWMGNWKKASETSNKIDKIGKNHKIINFFACIFCAF